MAILGYARVSTREQKPDSQREELQRAGAEIVFIDHGVSSTIASRPQWLECKKHLRPGDTLVIRELSRIAGSEVMAIEQIRELGARGVRLKSLNEPFLDIDTSTAMGEAILGIMAVMAQLRVSTIRENTRRGLEYARAQGRVGGRPTVMTPERLRAAQELRKQGFTITQIARSLKVGRTTVHNHLSDKP